MTVFKRQLQSGTGVEASPERVWDVLTDFERYPEWNPLIVRIKGELEQEAKLKVTAIPPGGRPLTFRPRVKMLDPPYRFTWLGRLAIPLLFDGRHEFEVEPLRGGGTHFVQRETFRGLLVPFMRRTLKRVDGGMRRMNEALARRAEAGDAREVLGAGAHTFSDS